LKGKVKDSTDYIKKLKKLSVKPGDIVVVTLKGQPYSYDMDNIHSQFKLMPFMKDVNVIIVTDKIQIKKSRKHSGKHQVFLDNLEYIEYLAKQKGAL